MTLIRHKLAAATAVAAAFPLVATPAAAVELPRVAGQQAVNAGALDVENHRHRGYRDWDDDDIDAGDVLAGVLILGGIAAIASAAGKQRERSYPPPEPYPGDAGYGEPYASDYRSGGMAQAVDTCVAEIEQGGDRIGSVDAVSREADGWRVSGALDGGMAYWCTIDGAGRVSGVGGSGTAYAEPVADAQYGDDYYANARAAKARGEAEGDLGEPGYAMAQAE
jgi:hypothetical protein